MEFTNLSKTVDNIVTFSNKAFNGLSRLVLVIGSYTLDSSVIPTAFTLPAIPDPLPDEEPANISVTIKLQTTDVSPSIYPQCTFTAYAGSTLLWSETRNIIVPGFIVAGTNSYCTVAEADAYHASRFSNDTWFTLNQGEKERALAGACKIFETVSWIGDKAIYDQALAWPRIITFPRTFYRSQLYLQNHDQPYMPVELAETPVDIKFGQAELAYQLVNGYLANSGVSRLKIGPVWIDSDNKELLPREVKNLVVGYICNQVRVIRT